MKLLATTMTKFSEEKLAQLSQQGAREILVEIASVEQDADHALAVEKESTRKHARFFVGLTLDECPASILAVPRNIFIFTFSVVGIIWECKHGVRVAEGHCNFLLFFGGHRHFTNLWSETI